MLWKTLARRAGARIRDLRKKKGLSQDKASEMAKNLSLRYWQYIEKGERNLTLDTLVKIAKALGVDPAELLKR